MPTKRNCRFGGALAVLLLGITTAASRLLMFASVQIFGSLRTVIIAILEVGVTLIWPISSSANG